MAVFGVVACPVCRKAKVFEVGRKTTTCGHCGRRLKLAELAIRHRSESLEDARHAVGILNARHAGAGEDAYVTAAGGAAEREPTRGEPVLGEARRVDAAVRGLGSAVWDEAAFAAALENEGVPAARAPHHLARLVGSNVVFEPTPGRFRVL